MFDGFTTERIDVGTARIHLRRGGDGPPVLLLHGYPQTHVMWHRVAPRLAERFTVIASDLRGYGDSSKPDSDPRHETYSKRTMAHDQVAVMEALGFRQFMVAGHDRGGRVAHRLVLDHPDRVTRWAVLDIVPTYKIFATVNKGVATGYYHWFFLIQPDPLPETMIGHDPEFYLRRKISQWSGDPDAFDPAAMAEYLRCFGDPKMIHASCEDYRAAATIDLEHDEADMEINPKAPLLCLWGRQGLMEKVYDVLATWRERVETVEGRALDCGHFLPEEAPDDTFEELNRFFSD